ncbi:hypothetical protein [Nonomuraea sp. NPDC002799]
MHSRTFFSGTARDGVSPSISGVTDDGPRATVQLFAAMLDVLPGAVGDVRPVRFDHAHPLDYLTSRPVTRALRRSSGSFVFAGGV